MNLRHSNFIKASCPDPIVESNRLLLVLSDLVKNCNSCRAKLMKMKMVSGNHPLTPTGHKADDDTTDSPQLPSKGVEY